MISDRLVICINDDSSRGLLKKGTRYKAVCRKYRPNAPNETPLIFFKGYSLMLEGLEDYWFKEERFQDIDTIVLKYRRVVKDL